MPSGLSSSSAASRDAASDSRVSTFLEAIVIVLSAGLWPARLGCCAGYMEKPTRSVFVRLSMAVTSPQVSQLHDQQLSLIQGAGLRIQPSFECVGLALAVLHALELGSVA